MSVVDDIKGRLDILDVVSRYAQIQRSGRSYKALCPFHTEKTPSFHVFPDRQSWRCFGACATGGDVFSFVMRIENLEFGEALRSLADQTGVKLAEARAQKGQGDVLYSINESAMEHFRTLLSSRREGSRAREYLKKRGLNQETIDRFQLGVSPGDGESLKAHLSSKGHTEEELALAGVVTKGQGAAYRDLFRRRLVFPIRDAEGRLCGFGGRALDDSNPKYLNTPRSPVFDKGQILYALHMARDAAKEDGIVIVEGYMDAVMAHQHGFSNVVASMGTALTSQQVALVRRAVRRPGAEGPGRVVLALDSDTAGQEATLRSLESSWNVFQSRPVGRTRSTVLYESAETPTLHVAPLAEGKDPDEIILESPEEWSRLVENAVPLMEYLFTALSSRLDLRAPGGKTRFAELLFPLITATHDPFEQDHYSQRLAAYLEVSEATLRASMGRLRQGSATRGGGRPASETGRTRQPRPSDHGQEQAATSPFARLEHDPLEEHCLTLLLRDPDLVMTGQASPRGNSGNGGGNDGGNDAPAGGIAETDDGVEGPRIEYFRRVENREVFTNWMKCSTLKVLKESLDEELSEHLDYLVARVLPPADRLQRELDLRYCVRRLKERYLRELNGEEEMRLSQVAPEELEEQERRLVMVNERLRDVFVG